MNPSKKGSVIVTGANGTLGAAIVRDIIHDEDLAASYTGLYTARRALTASTLQAALNSSSFPHHEQVLDLELSSLARVKSFADRINEKVSNGQLPPIRALILNAGYQDAGELVSSFERHLHAPIGRFI